MYDTNSIAKAVQKAIADYERLESDQIKIGVSQRHVHLSREDLDILFGKGYELTKKKTLMGREFASEEVVTLVGPSLKSIENVRVLGPVRANTQVEISRTDTFVLKVSPPVRPSGKVEGSERIVLVGPKGSVYLKEGVIIANRHIHLTPEYADRHAIKDNDYVDVLVEGVKPTKFYDVQVRVRDDFNVEMHIDTDDANSAGLKNGALVTILKKDGKNK
ncbi:MAG: phosphate propanoyltransferase [Clostridia bacterium]|nr:phosphate propanoyltransferase [Clostridia bacterium]